MHQRESERAFLEFALWLDQDQGLPVEIYLHYQDQEPAGEHLGGVEMISKVSHLVRRGHLMKNISANQISFSATSTIGFELFSQGIAHLFITGKSAERHVPRGRGGRLVCQFF